MSAQRIAAPHHDLGFTTEVTLSGADPSADSRAAASAIRDHEVVWMHLDTTPDDLRAYFDSLVEHMGTPVSAGEDFENGGVASGERWSEIRYDVDIPDDAAFRYSKNAQPLHTDESYVPAAAGIMLFYCVAAAPSGGETVFVSGRDLVDELTRSEPELLDRLERTTITYRKADRAKSRPIIDRDELGGVTLNFNFYCADPCQPEDAIQLNEDFHRYLENDLPDELILPVALQPGEAVAWRDELVLHGRNAFSATTSGDRCIWKTSLILGPED